LETPEIFFILYYFFICILFYLIGSIPFAYLILKFRHRKDITEEGSGNVGTMNAYETSGSKTSGVIVLLLDVVKGAVPVWWFLNYSGLNPYFLLIPSFLIVLGHNFSIWLKFKGGRGLATAAGMMLIVNFILIAAWVIVFFLVFLVRRNIHIANVTATVLLPLLLVFFQDFFIDFSNPVISSLKSPFEFLFAFSSSVCLLILIRHIQPIIELINKK
jgi:glycerol-3-phosphate acyltransferase PlsY